MDLVYTLLQSVFSEIKFAKKAVLFWILMDLSVLCSTANHIIATTNGKVRGKLTQGIYGHTYYYFDGIPYALPPLGDLRFKAPRPIGKWEEIKDCTQSPNKCLQWNRRSNEIQGSEDCLYLNINVKTFNASKLLPVMVYIHGGAFNTGDPTRRALGPDYLMMKDIVFITIGYRLGILGFASFTDDSLGVPGNAGLKDIVLALRWIQSNCRQFNGDPENITLFGHSSGGTATNILMQTPSAAGLFHKAILLAGFCMAEPYLPKLEFRIAKSLGFKGVENDEKSICKFLSHVEASALINFQEFSEEEKLLFDTLYPYFIVLPTVETYIDDETIMQGSRVQAQRSAWSNNIPLLMGSNSNESLYNFEKRKYGNEIYELLKNQPKFILPMELRVNLDEELQEKAAKMFKLLHFGEKELTKESYDCLLENNAYNALYHYQHRLLQSRLKYATALTFVYRFAFDSPIFNLYRIRTLGPGVKGVGHADELSYIFYMPNSFKLETSTPEYKCIEQMIETLYAFAKTSDPNHHRLQSVVWEPVNRQSPAPMCLNINYEETTFVPVPEYEKCCVRDSIFKKFNIDLY